MSDGWITYNKEKYEYSDSLSDGSAAFASNLFEVIIRKCGGKIMNEDETFDFTDVSFNDKEKEIVCEIFKVMRDKITGSSD